MKFVWEECLPVEFTNYILQEDNYKALSVLNLNYQKCSDIVLSYLKSGNHRLNIFTQYVSDNLTTLKYAFAILFPKMFSRTVSSGIVDKTAFDFKYHNWWNKKFNQQHYQLQTAQDLTDSSVEEVSVQLGKDINSYKTRPNIDPNEQRPLVDTSIPSNDKYVRLSKVILSKPKIPKEIFNEKAKAKRNKIKLELEKN